jgi:hypothetical protein
MAGGTFNLFTEAQLEPIDALPKMADGGSIDTPPVTVVEVPIGDYPEDDLEPIDEPSGGGGAPSPEPPPDDNIPNIDELLERIEQIKANKFKFPTMGKVMFNAELSTEDLFYKYQAFLVLNNRLSKNVLRKKNPMSLIDANGYLDFIRDYFNYLKLIVSCLDYVKDGYYINPNKQVTINLSKLPFASMGAMGTSSTSMPDTTVSLAEVETLLLDSPDIMDIFTSEAIIQYFENILVTDFQLYRIISLAAFFNPEFFGEFWMKPHMDYIFNYYRTSEIGFSNISSAAFELRRIDNTTIFSMMRQNLNVYNIIRSYTLDDYNVYVFENLRPISGDLSVKVNSYIKSLSDLSKDGGILVDDLCADLQSFYQFSMNLQGNPENKNLTLFNLQKISNLQKESYDTFIRDIDLQTILYGSI